MTTIVSFADLATALDLSKPAFTDYPDLEQIADSVHDSLEDHAGRSLSGILKQTESGYNSTADDLINLNNLPISSITSVKVNGVSLTSSEYTINAYGLELEVPFIGKWEVVSKGGFKTIPKNIYRAELSQIVYEYQNRNNLASTATNSKGGSVRNEGFVVLKDVQRLLRRYYHIDNLGF